MTLQECAAVSADLHSDAAFQRGFNCHYWPKITPKVEPNWFPTERITTHIFQLVWLGFLCIGASPHWSTMQCTGHWPASQIGNSDPWGTSQVTIFEHLSTSHLLIAANPITSARKRKQSPRSNLHLSPRWVFWAFSGFSLFGCTELTGRRVRENWGGAGSATPTCTILPVLSSSSDQSTKH